MKLITAVLAIVFSSSAVLAQVYQPPDRQVLSLPEIKVPVEAQESGLGGTVRVTVLVNNSGSVIAVGDTFGPDNVCPSVSRPDVVALRDAARTIAEGAKFSPNLDASQPIEQRVFLEVFFPKASKKDPNAEEKGITYAGPVKEVKKEEKSATKDRFTIIGDRNFEASSGPPPNYQGPVNTGTTGSGNSGEGRRLSGGVLNGKAGSLPKPPYPPAARAVRADGPVVIQVLIDESGSVFTAEPVSGHPLLRAAARNAACGAQFSPTLLEGKPVKVSGVITYNFVAP